MMGIFQEWIQNIVVFLLLMTMAGQLIPDEKYKKYIRLTMGLLLILVVLLPLTRLAGMDKKIYQNFIRESFRISAEDAQAGESIVGMEGQFAEGYKQMIEEEVRLYFEANAMVLKYCEFDMDSDAESENYGQIYKMRVGILPKDRDISGTETTDSLERNGNQIQNSKASGEITPVDIGEIKIGGDREAAAASEENETSDKAGMTESFVPEEKIEQWKQDVSIQFGIDAEQLELEILS